MEPEHHQEWNALSDAAGDLLRKGEWRLRLGSFPSFGDAWVIGIVPVVRRFPDRLREHGFDVHARRWQYDVDMAKFASPVERLKHPLPRIPPTIESRVARIDEEAVWSLLGELDALSTSVFPRTYPAGLDGVSHELDLNISWGACRASFRWWGDGPDSWKPLIDWCGEAWKRLGNIAGVPSDNLPHL